MALSTAPSAERPRLAAGQDRFGRAVRAGARESKGHRLCCEDQSRTAEFVMSHSVDEEVFLTLTLWGGS